MSRIELYFDWNGDRVRISGAKLRTQEDADELVEAISIIRRLLPSSAATEKAAGTPPAGETCPDSPAPIPPATAAQTGRAPEPATTSPAEDDAVASSATSSEAGKPAGSKGSAAPTRTDRLRALHAEHPELTAREAGERLGIEIKHVRALSQNAALKWAPAKQGRPSKAPEPPRPPIAAQPSSAGSTIVTKPMAKPPKGTRFFLRNDAGEYLHFSCMQMTTLREHAWRGDAGHMSNVRRKFPIAAELREQVIETEKARAFA